MIDASILLLQDAAAEAAAMKERAYALAPWLRDLAVPPDAGAP